MSAVNKTIHEARGLQLQDCGESGHTLSRPFGFCVKCGAEYPHLDAPNYPDYTDPVHYCALMDWMREEGRPEDFCIWLDKRYKLLTTITLAYELMSMSRKERITLIAEAIEAGVLK